MKYIPWNTSFKLQYNDEVDSSLIGPFEITHIIARRYILPRFQL
jgi:hypothetical protein